MCSADEWAVLLSVLLSVVAEVRDGPRQERKRLGEVGVGNLGGVGLVI